MLNVQYKSIEETYILEDNVYISYGIVAYTVNNENEFIEVIHDISQNRIMVERLVELSNHLRLSTIHLTDVVIDMIE